MSRILVLAPHTDDGEIGCGGTIAKNIERGDSVYYVAFSIAEESVPKDYPRDILKYEVKKATKKLGLPEKNLIIKNYKVRHFPENRQSILEDLVQLNKDIEPDLVFLPSSFDIHQDHKTIHQEGIRAFKNTSMLGYEFMWNHYSFGSTLFSVLDEDKIEKKINSLNEYKSQKARFYTAEKLIKGLANFRGLQISEEYAEAFEVIRWIMR